MAIQPIKLVELPDHQLLIDNQGRIRSVDTVKFLVKQKDPADVGRIWYTRKQNSSEPDLLVSID